MKLFYSQRKDTCDAQELRSKSDMKRSILRKVHEPASGEDDGTDEEGPVAGSRTPGAIGSEGRWLFPARLVTMSNVLLLSALLTASPLNTGHAKGRPSLNFVLSALPLPWSATLLDK